MITVEALPARAGDCLWVEWDDGGRRRRMLIDGGTVGAGPALAERFARQPVGERDFELIVCTHLDDDHIGGLLALLTSPPEGFGTRDIWFNGQRHLLPPDMLGMPKAEKLTALLAAAGTPWNAATGGRAVVVPTDDGEPLPVVELPGLTLTLLSPTFEGLAALRDTWDEWQAEQRRKARGEPPAPPDLLGPPQPAEEIPWHQLALEYTPDKAPANGSSIAFCAEHTGDGSRVLFTGDAHAEVLVGSLERLASDGRYRVDLCKVPHHGSAHNTSPELLAVLDCDQWLITTHGGHKVRGDKPEYLPSEGSHPSRPTMARLVLGTRWPTVWFNYRAPSTERYEDGFLQQRLGFSAKYPPHGTGGITLVVERGTVTQAPPPPG
ncbi:ComEC/Rec2 family competence protein [Streptomyces sp. NPDC019890]|uniref:ComEC/Rec2 family competence protein n=1 Tax=Streptomyces sp. NPDC019890 TaxID=3365064 RepID=UPI00384D1992